MNPDQKPKQVAGVVKQSVNNEVVLYHAELGNIHILNATAERIWELCDGAHSIGAIADDLKARFQIGEEESLQEDVAETLAQFAEKKLLAFAQSS